MEELEEGVHSMSSHCGSSSLGFFYKPVQPLKPNCFRYLYHVDDGCIE